MGYKINKPKFVVFLYTNNKLSKIEVKKTIPFTIKSKIIKYLIINLTKEVKDVYCVNCKTLKKKKSKTTLISRGTYCAHELTSLKYPYY